jgi:methyl-accepting chemotaxis protein
LELKKQMVGSFKNLYDALYIDRADRRRRMKDLKISKKLLVSFLTIAIIATIVGGFGVFGQATIFGDVESMYQEPVRALDALSNTRYAFNVQKATIWQAYAKSDDSSYLTEAGQTISSSHDILQAAFTQYEATVSDWDKEDDYLAFQKLYESIYPEYTVILEAIGSGDLTFALSHLNTLAEDLQGATNMLNNIADLNMDIAHDLDEEAATTFGILTVISVALLAIAFSTAMYFTVYITKLIAKPIEQIEHAAAKLASGSLDVAIQVDSKDEIGKMAKSFLSLSGLLKAIIPDIDWCLKGLAAGNFAVDSRTEKSYIGDLKPIYGSFIHIKETLAGTIQQIQGASEQVRSGAQSMAEGAQFLAVGASTQATRIDELSSTMDELLDQVEQSVHGVDQAATNAVKVEENALSSQDCMSKMILAMERIDTTSSKIQDIINTIEEIASQTNLLSLNAAIEAARAGEAGRGFAVVADEIRQLASQSAQAATNTRELIQTSVTEVHNGNKIVQETSTSIDLVISDIKGIAQMIDEIRVASHKQSDYCDTVNQKITQIASLVQDTAATAQESSAVSEELSAQSDTLNSLMEQFKI